MHQITLLGVAYKIMSKALVVRVLDVAKEIMAQEQTSFVIGRFILDILLSSWEAMEWENELGQRKLFLKIDFDKAYHCIDWNLITSMLTYLGFGKRCVSMENTLFFMLLLLFQ